MNVAASTRLPAAGRERVMITPEGVALPLTIASRGARVGALFLDLFFIGLLMTVTTVILLSVAGGAITGGAVTDKGPLGQLLETLAVIWIITIFLFRNAYFLFFELGPRGATPGKRITGIRIAARDGGRLSAEMVIARNLLRDIELFLPLVFIASASSEGGDMGAAGIAATAWFLIFMLFPLFNKDRLRAGDVIAGSWVVEAPKRKLEAAMSVAPAAQVRAGPAAESAPAYRFGEAELAVYGEYELQMLERVLRDNRPEAMQAVYEAICIKIGWTAGHSDARPFLEAYYRALRQRLETGMRMGKRKADKFA
ncbi:RDD family protein [Novosphingobium sp. G106]|uniref:RDD family protein n=1 Tax=Novosphingobium sp. G106 TaxID=2849500 RepID=UPI001C2D4F7B|nr:RDD family protein [Novosphingobium sp. G106]MBV1690451.1 RDD family protein [Novosphingobium sp. G106]